ncbi:MAG: low molecular weight protein-tyrosine-phosphatase [Candidatus Spyradosoma sp.]
MKKILFVCLGNICRSPAADGIFSRRVAEAGLSDAIACDSCGTGDWHVGDLPDPRMRAAGTRRGFDFTHRARRLRDEDFAAFDLLVVMDEQNRRDVLARAPRGFDAAKVRLFTEFCTGEFAALPGVPDPYWSGDDGFDRVLDILEDGCSGLLKKLAPPPGDAR